MGNKELGFRVTMFLLVVPGTFWVVIRWGLGPDESLMGLTIWWTAVTVVTIMVDRILREKEMDKEFARKLLLWEAVRGRERR